MTASRHSTRFALKALSLRYRPLLSRKSDQPAKSLLRRTSLINRAAARRRLRTTYPVWNAPTNGISLMVAFRAVSAQGSRMTLVALKRKTIKTPPGWALEVSAR